MRDTNVIDLVGSRADGLRMSHVHVAFADKNMSIRVIFLVILSDNAEASISRTLPPKKIYLTSTLDTEKGEF